MGLMIKTPYEDLLRDVLENGSHKDDRTGTGTTSVFGRQIRYDLSEGFPLITTKRMFLRGMVEELLWIISGSTSEHALRDRGVHFWRQWARSNGDLGPTYGKQMRHAAAVLTVRPELFDPEPTDYELPALRRPGSVRDLNAKNTYGVGYIGDYDKSDPNLRLLLGVWRQMIRRCYDEACGSYPGYGGRGVHVSREWHCFANFQEDAKRIPGWTMKLEYPDDYSLDKDAKLASNRYDRSTCIWASENVQNANKSNTKPFTAVNPSGEIVTIPSIGWMKRNYGVNLSAVHRCLNGQLNTHHGWTNFSYIEAPPGEVVRYFEVDQLRSIVADLKHAPHSRRLMISLWNPSEVDLMELPPCHGVAIQFYVLGGRLSCQVYQRSGDLFLGVPVNIASYALFTHMLAQQANLEVGELIWTGGDCHIYDNHVEQVREQLSREPYPYPTLELRKRDSIDEYEYEDVQIVGYKSHPAIKAEVAV